MIRILFVLLTLAFTQTAASAASFQAKRGIALDVWVTWPAEEDWAQEGVLSPFPEWRKSVGEAELKSLKNKGFDFVRMPIDPAVLVSPQTPDIRDRLIADIADAVTLINGEGLKVIVDLHAMPAGGNRQTGTKEILGDAAIFDTYLESVRQIGAVLKDRDPTLVAFELFNEPVIDCDEEGTNLWPDMLKRAFAAARASTLKTTLILSGACWGSAEALAKINPAEFPDDNLIWSFHSYEPFLFSHQGATWAGDFAPHVFGLPFPLHEASDETREKAYETIRQRISDNASFTRRSGLLTYFDEQIAAIDSQEELEAAMNKPFETVAAWAKSNAIDPSIILLGEFGMIRQEYGNDHIVPAAERARFYRRTVEIAEKHGFAWSMWSYGGAFGLVESFESKPAEPDVLDMVQALPPR